MAVLRKDLRRITFNMPKQLLEDLEIHIKKFDTDRGMWLREAAKEKLMREKIILDEMSDEY